MITAAARGEIRIRPWAVGEHEIPLEETMCMKALHKDRRWVTSGIWDVSRGL